jgi:hypothetical protein
MKSYGGTAGQDPKGFDIGNHVRVYRVVIDLFRAKIPLEKPLSRTLLSITELYTKVKIEIILFLKATWNKD